MFSILKKIRVRIRNDKEPISPNPNLSHASNFLYMLKGEEPDKEIFSGSNRKAENKHENNH